jgi:hypothetical protein
MATKAPSKWTIFGTIVGFLIGIIIGPGSLWQWKQHQLDRVVKTMELLKQENDVYAKIIELSAEYVKAMDQHEKNPADNTMYLLKARLDVLKNEFKTRENSLAQLEGREPQSIPLEFIPPRGAINLQGTVR